MEESSHLEEFNRIVNEELEDVFDGLSGREQLLELTMGVLDIFKTLLDSLGSAKYSMLIIEDLPNHMDDLPRVPQPATYSDWENPELFDKESFEFSETLLFRARLTRYIEVTNALFSLGDEAWKILINLSIAALPVALGMFHGSITENQPPEEALKTPLETMEYFDSFSSFRQMRSVEGDFFWKTFKENYLVKLIEDTTNTKDLIDDLHLLNELILNLPLEKRIAILSDISSTVLTILGNICKMYIGCEHDDFVATFLNDMRSELVSITFGDKGLPMEED